MIVGDPWLVSVVLVYRRLLFIGYRVLLVMRVVCLAMAILVVILFACYATSNVLYVFNSPQTAPNANPTAPTPHSCTPKTSPASSNAPTQPTQTQPTVSATPAIYLA